jgi:hypothetical protein
MHHKNKIHYIRYHIYYSHTIEKFHMQYICIRTKMRVMSPHQPPSGGPQKQQAGLPGDRQVGLAD